MNQAPKNPRTPFWLMTLCTLLLILITSWYADAQTRDKLWNPFAGNQAAIDQGAQFFRAFCWGCHARTAREGATAPDLLLPQWLYGWTEAGLFETIYDGIPNKPMRNFGGKLTEEEIWKIISYVRSEQEKAAGITQKVGTQPTINLAPYQNGDAAAGEKVFFSETIACGKCHTVRGKGGYGTGSEAGADLSYIARTRSPQFIMESILNPRAYIGPQFETVTIITKDGKEITGRKRRFFDRDGDEDPVAFQILDKSGKLWTTYFTRNVKESFTPKTGIMPENFGQITTEKELRDLLAYLLTLK